MKNHFTLATVCAALSLACGGPAVSRDHQELHQVGELMSELESLGQDTETFRMLIARGDLQGELAAPGTAVTLFLPPEHVLAAWVADHDWVMNDRELVQELVRYHMLSAPMAAGDLDEQPYETRAVNSYVHVVDRGVSLRDEMGRAVQILQSADVAGSKLHYVDRVMLPDRRVMGVVAARGYKKFWQAMEMTGMSEVVAHSASATVFAMSDDVMMASGLDPASADAKKLAQVMSGHVLFGRRSMDKVCLSEVESARGDVLECGFSDARGYEMASKDSKARVSRPNMAAFDGYVHEISEPLFMWQ